MEITKISFNWFIFVLTLFSFSFSVLLEQGKYALGISLPLLLLTIFSAVMSEKKGHEVLFSIGRKRQ